MIQFCLPLFETTLGLTMSTWSQIGYFTQILFITLAILFSSFISVYLITYIKFKTIPKLKMVNHKIKILSIFANILYCIAMISYLLGHSLINNINWIGIPYNITQCTWSAANCFVYIIFLFRIHITFKNTIHKINRNVYIFICIFIIMYFICEQLLVLLELFVMYSIIDSY